MLAVFGNIKNYVKLKGGKIEVDSIVSKLHYRFTFVILLASSILVTSSQFFGTAIFCIQDAMPPAFPAVPQQALNQYCYISATFSVPVLFNHLANQQAAHPGVGPAHPTGETTFHNYYQWVPFVLLLQAIMFYTPHYVWKNLEGGKVKSIMAGLTTITIGGAEDGAVKPKIDALSKYFHNSLHNHKSWGFKFVFCEMLNFVNAIGQIYFTDYFLGGAFLTYGSEVLKWVNLDPEVRTDPMSRVFPRMTKCTFEKYGPSGTIQKHDSLCLLAINIINEKIYIFLWFWFVILAVITGVGALYRLLTIFFSSVRERELMILTGRQGRNHVEIVASKCDYGDWLLLDILVRNIVDQRVSLGFLETLSNMFGFKTKGYMTRDESELTYLNSKD